MSAVIDTSHMSRRELRRLRQLFRRASDRAQRRAHEGARVAVVRPGSASAEQQLFRGLSLYCRGTTPDRVQLPFLPEEIGRDGLADVWDTIERPGRDPIVYRSGGAAEKLSFAVEVAHTEGLGVGATIELVRDMARSATPVVVSISRRKWMAMRISGMSVTETEHTNAGNPKRATLDLELTRETTVAAAPGPVKIPRRKERRIKADQAARRRERQQANKRDNQHARQELPKGPSRHQSPAQARAWAHAYVQQKWPHWGDEQWQAIVWIFNKESGWRWNAQNPSSSAYGIPQALPGSKMSSAGSDWHDNAYTQIKWGINYMISRYGSPVGARRAWESKGWY